MFVIKYLPFYDEILMSGFAKDVKVREDIKNLFYLCSTATHDECSFTYIKSDLPKSLNENNTRKHLNHYLDVSYVSINCVYLFVILRI